MARLNGGARRGLWLELALIVGATTLATAVPAMAWVSYFHNSGTVNSGWNGTSVEHWGFVGDSTSAVYRGPTSIKTMQVYDPSYTGRYHAEKVSGTATSRATPPSMALRFACSRIGNSRIRAMQQFIANYTSVPGHCDDWMPTSMIWLYGRELHTRVKAGTNTTSVSTPTDGTKTATRSARREREASGTIRSPSGRRMQMPTPDQVIRPR